MDYFMRDSLMLSFESTSFKRYLESFAIVEDTLDVKPGSDPRSPEVNLFKKTKRKQVQQI